tara:strand:- start:145 stop:279 length:135 start_codon:yes stop_codon:yes gene_type:complete
MTHYIAGFLAMENRLLAQAGIRTRRFGSVSAGLASASTVYLATK